MSDQMLDELTRQLYLKEMTTLGIYMTIMYDYDRVALLLN